MDPNLAVRTNVSGLDQPIAMAFMRANDFFVTEKASGKVKRVQNGVVTATVLDLPVNSSSERGLLGIALHPRFKDNGLVYLYWTESSTGQDSTDITEVGNPNSAFPPGTPRPLGNRVDRFVWNGSAQTLTYDRNLIRLHAYQHDNNNPSNPNPLAAYQGNHNGGVLRFQMSELEDDDNANGDDQGDHNGNGRHKNKHNNQGNPGKGHDGDDEDDEDDQGEDSRQAKLFIIIGDNGRRGVMQNLINGPFGPGIPDDEFGGPEPDNNHLTGVVLRLNDDGTTPTDNPFYQLGAMLGGEVGANIQKVFAYGVRNSFGLAIDPRTGDLWESENGDDAFDEINHIQPGHNGGWVQIMGPVSRIQEFKTIEVNLFVPPGAGALQQLRWPPTRIADTPAEALSRLVMLPGAHYADPEFSWRYATAPAAVGFMKGDSLGTQYDGDLFVGAARPTLAKGYLFRFNLTEDRTDLDLSADPRLADRVADNGIFPPPVGTPPGTPGLKFDVTESESLLFGSDFGIGTDIQTGPEGNLFVVSTSNGEVYEIYRVAKDRERPDD